MYFHLDGPVRTSFTLHKKPGSLHQLLEERNARFTHPLIFLQCYSVFFCITRKHTIPKPFCHSLPISGEAAHPFVLPLSCTHISTLSMPSVLPDSFHDKFYSISVGVPCSPISSDRTIRFQFEPRLPQIHPPHVQLSVPQAPRNVETSVQRVSLFPKTGSQG